MSKLKDFYDHCDFVVVKTVMLVLAVLAGFGLIKSHMTPSTPVSVTATPLPRLGEKPDPEITVRVMVDKAELREALRLAIREIEMLNSGTKDGRGLLLRRKRAEGVAPATVDD